MKSGFCPKCESNEIFVDESTTEQTHRMGDLTFQIYICLNCGYSEQYLTEHDREQIQKHLEDREKERRKANKKKKEI